MLEVGSPKHGQELSMKDAGSLWVGGGDVGGGTACLLYFNLFLLLMIKINL